MCTVALRFQRHAGSLLVLLAVAFPLAAMSPRITFERLLPAPHDLGKARELAIVHAIGDTHAIDLFVDNFVDTSNHSGVLRLRDARLTTGEADAYLDIKTFTCETSVHEGEGSTRDYQGNRVKRRQAWADALCIARIDVMSKEMQRISTFHGKGEGTSPRVETLTDEEKMIALRQAAKYAAIDAAQRITPRRVREVIPLDETAPEFDQVLALIDAGQIAEARTQWEGALRKEPRSASLHFNLAAVCEALGDRKAARAHYIAASELAPKDERYKSEMRLFSRRE